MPEQVTNSDIHKALQVETKALNNETEAYASWSESRRNWDMPWPKAIQTQGVWMPWGGIETKATSVLSTQVSVIHAYSLKKLTTSMFI